MSRPACSAIAATTAGWQWPALFIEIPAMQSTKRRPSASNRDAPSPRTNATGWRR